MVTGHFNILPHSGSLAEYPVRRASFPYVRHDQPYPMYEQEQYYSWRQEPYPPYHDFEDQSIMTPIVDPFILAASEEKVGHSPDAHKLSLSPQSQVPSPSLHEAASSYFTGASSSLESALNPAATTAGRSRANTSISPPSHSPFSLSPSGSNSTLEASVSQQHPQTVIGKMLKE
jgi:hypothetical protein